MKWWDDYAVPIFGLIGLIAVGVFCVFGFGSIFFGVSELSGFEMGFGIIGVMGLCIIVATLISRLVGLAPYTTLGNDDEEEVEAEEEKFIERRVNRPHRTPSD